MSLPEPQRARHRRAGREAHRHRSLLCQLRQPPRRSANGSEEPAPEQSERADPDSNNSKTINSQLKNPTSLPLHPTGERVGETKYSIQFLIFILSFLENAGALFLSFHCFNCNNFYPSLRMSEFFLSFTYSFTVTHLDKFVVLCNQVLFL